MRNILILADLAAPFMLPRIAMLRELPYKKYILHSANNIKLSQEVLENYRDDFIVLEHRKINNRHLRYLYSFFYTLYLLIRLNPKLIVVHWASRLYQNLLLALWGERVIVHTMGGDIDSKQDYNGHKQKFTALLLRKCRIVTIKSQAMLKMLEKINIDLSKVIYLSWGVEQRFWQSVSREEQTRLQQKLYGKEFDCLFFSIRALSAFYQQKEIIESFTLEFKNNMRVGLLVSFLRKDEAYFHSIANIDSENLLFKEIPHKEMEQYLMSCDCVISFSQSDGFSQSIMEAAALKKWVLTDSIAHHSEVLRDKENAIYCENVLELTKGFKEALCKIHYMPKLREEAKNFLDYRYQKYHYLRILREYFNV